mmetsp:Transcript_1144/g.1513  ORF Transcript_1144/g.1513 Transcript_1144/m.1513 type:complete len:167 (+) Transcript_1144:154-654(+)
MPTKRGSGTRDNPIFRILIFFGWLIMAVSTDGLTEGNEIVDFFPSPEEKSASEMFNDAKKKTLMQRRTLRARRYNSKRYTSTALVENQREYSRNLEFSLSMSMSMGYFALKSLSHSYSYNYSYSYGPQKRQLRNQHRKNDSVEIDDRRRREMEKIIADITDPQFWE